MPQNQLPYLEAQLDKLIAHCKALEQENTHLRQAQQHWLAEKSSLLLKQQLACSTLETLVARLQALEAPAL